MAYQAIAAGTQMVSGVAQAGAGIALGFINASTMREQGKIAMQRAQFNADMANLRADRLQDAIGQKAKDYMEQVGDLVGKQKVATAAQNVVVGKGVSRRIEVETRAKAQDNVLRMKAAAGNQIRALRQGADFTLLEGITQKEAADKAALFSSMRSVASGIEQGAKAVGDAMKAGVFEQKKQSSANSLQPKLTTGAERGSGMIGKLSAANRQEIANYSPPDKRLLPTTTDGMLEAVGLGYDWVT